MVPEFLFSLIVWIFGPLVAFVGAIVLIYWLVGEIREGYYKAQ